MRIAILGGTGREGRGLALRWARAGHQVVIGSRDAQRAVSAAEELSALGCGVIEGGDTAQALDRAEVVVVSVPYSAHQEVLASLREAIGARVVIDITVPLRPPKVQVVSLPPGQAAALEAQAVLGPECKLAAALHHVGAAHLGDPGHPIDCDVLVCSDHEDARDVTIRLVADLGLRGLDAGPLRNAVALESLTPVLLHLNKRYGAKGAGVRFTGIPS
jgi:NADPH-dependent F420 reductase